MAALLAVCLQLLAIFGPLGSDDLPRRLLFILSYLILFVFVAANLRRPGIAVIGLGLALNFIVIAANGGLMPITPETLLRTGSIPNGAETGEWVEHSKDVLKEREDVRLYFLSDRLVWDGVSPIRAFSIGDVVLLAGLGVTLLELFVPRLDRGRHPEAS
jgi:hypothetical protein